MKSVTHFHPVHHSVAGIKAKQSGLKLSPPTEVGMAIVAMLVGVMLGNLYAGNFQALWEILVAILLFSILSLTVLLMKATRSDRRRTGRPWLIAASLSAVVTDLLYLFWEVEAFLVFGLNLTAILLLVSALRSRP